LKRGACFITDENKNSIKESVKSDLDWVSTHPLIREELKKGFQGYVFDIKTGELEKVENV
jgi:carbonic anhydrase